MDEQKLDPRPQLNRHLSFQLSKNFDENYSEEINILILGETGTGKSTTINALANYLKFYLFEEALSVNEFLNLIPSKFRLPDPKTGGSFVIEDAAHENEHQHEDGAAKISDSTRALSECVEDPSVVYQSSSSSFDCEVMRLEKRNIGVDGLELVYVELNIIGSIA